MARAYHVHPNHPAIQRYYISTENYERRLLKKRGWRKVRYDELPAVLGVPHLADQLRHAQPGTSFVSTDEPAFGGDGSRRLIHEGLLIREGDI